MAKNMSTTKAPIGCYFSMELCPGVVPKFAACLQDKFKFLIRYNFADLPPERDLKF